ncbi:MAG: hypothetical protein WAW41_01915 [Methylobacter sp.]
MAEGILNEIRFLPALEEVRDILKERGLIPFDSKMVMGFTPHQVVGYGPLSEQGISRDVPALNVDDIEERDGYGNLIGLFDFFIIYRETPHFFWV